MRGCEDGGEAGAERQRARDPAGRMSGGGLQQVARGWGHGRSCWGLDRTLHEMNHDAHEIHRSNR
jgi:hypothetical protein